MNRDEYLQWVAETCGQEEVDHLLTCGEELPLHILPIVRHDELPEEFLDVVKVRITGWRPVILGDDKVKIPVLRPEWTLVPKDWPGEEPTAIKPAHRNIFFD